MQRLIAIMEKLRDPVSGCPWDVQQDFRSIAPYTIEEAYEVADAIERGDLADLRDELGDLLLQVVFHSRMAQEQGAFAFEDVADAICEKMVRRHPHVFAGLEVSGVEEQTALWEQGKRAEFAAGKGHAALEDELGDVLFVCANLARHGKVDFGGALRRANAKFERRFRRMEALASAEGVELSALSLEAQDAYWNRAKAEERAAGGGDEPDAAR